MAQWGRNDKPVTMGANTTRPETSNGAPIGTYALVKGDQVNRVNGANAHFGDGSAGSRANTDYAMFGNTSQDAFIVGKAVGVFGVDMNEIQTQRAQSVARPAHAGWVLRTEGSGGRAGRVQYETLVAMGSLGAQTAGYGTAANPSDASDDTTLPDAVLTIATQPTAKSANASNNESTTFTVGATVVPSTATPTYLWYSSNTGPTSGFATTVGNTAFSGQTTTTLTVNSATVAVNTWVRAVVSVTGGASVNSASVKLTVTA